MKYHILLFVPLLMLISCGEDRESNNSPLLIIDEGNGSLPRTALAIFPPRDLLKKYEVTEDEYKPFAQLMLETLLAEGVRSSLGPMTGLAKRPTEELPLLKGLGAEATAELINNTKFETWELNEDGSHKIMTTISLGKITIDE